MKTSTLWYILSAVFFLIGLISALGEWVFHWWTSPGDLLSPLGFLLALVTLAQGATSGDVEGLRTEQAAGFERIERQLSQLSQLSEIRQDIAGLRAGQEEQTRLLRELVASFRPRAEG